MCVGWMAPLKAKISKELRAEIDEYLYDSDSNVRINYEGTIAYTKTEIEPYGISFGVKGYYNPNAFEILKNYDVYAKQSEGRSYTSYYYNGCDSYMDTMTLETFYDQTNQTPVT